MPNPIVIIGAGGFARETLDVIDAINNVKSTWDMLGYIVDSQYGEPGVMINDKPILGDPEWFESNKDVYAICGIGAPEVRYRIINRIKQFNLKFATLIHPSVLKTRWMTVGPGTIITAGCILSNNIEIKEHVHINPSSTIGHDATIDSFVSLAPGALISGNIHINQGTYIGTGSQIIEKMSIGAWSIIGAGATVIKDTPPNTISVGNPAKVIKKLPNGWHSNDN